MKISLLILFVSIFMFTGCTSPKKQMNTEKPVATTGSRVDKTPEGDSGNTVAPTGAMYDINTMSIKALGNEPFWNFIASGTTLNRNQPNASGTIDTTTYNTIVTTQTPTTVSLSDSGLNALLTLQSCSDGMSENTYTHNVVVTIGTDVYNGCANITP